MAELFSAYLQKEMTHNICIDFKPPAEMNGWIILCVSTEGNDT